MLNALFIPGNHPNRWLLTVYILATLGSILTALALEEWWIAGLPVLVLLAWFAVVDFYVLFYLLLLSLPLSIEMELPGGFATDLPSEPLMWALMGISGLWFLQNWRSVDSSYIRHPITLVLLVHLGWMGVCVVLSQDFFVSFKFYLAKLWYVVVFYFLSSRIFSTEQNFRRLLWLFYIPLFFTVIWVLVRHSALDFSFESVNYAMGPFYRNHVMYACLLAVFLPFIWFGRYWYRTGSARWWFLVTGTVLLLTGINFAYTRAAYVALFAATGFYWLVRFRLTKYALMALLAGFILFAGFVGSRDNWLEFAPDYERTVTHTRFDNLLEATTKLEDISTMERVYRWVAASYMIKEKPLTGFGPGTFYFFYKNYTVTSFQTYVSDNPERSGIHNYYLMTAVEQGIPGLIIFLVFCVVIMLRGEALYHRLQTPWKKRMAMAALLAFVLVDILMLMNDLVETDKIGSLFFMSAAMLAALDLSE